MDIHDSSDDDVVEKDVAYLAKNFRKFLKFKNNGKFGNKGKFMNSGKEKKDFKKKDGNESQSTQEVTCFECNGHGYFKKECLNYLRMKARHMPQHLVTRTLQILILIRAVTEKEITPHS